MLQERTHWIFDLDGTLTRPVHDFDAIRAMLGVPNGHGILEWLSALPVAERDPLFARLDEHEQELAGRAEAAEGASGVLAALHAAGYRMGIVTRNNLRNVERTLEAAGLTGYFERGTIMTRENALPKPAPDGILKLLGAWSTDAERAVMVGNHLHDLAAGRAAGVATVHVDPSGVFEWSDFADVLVVSLQELIPSTLPG